MSLRRLLVVLTAVAVAATYPLKHGPRYSIGEPRRSRIDRPKPPVMKAAPIQHSTSHPITQPLKHSRQPVPGINHDISTIQGSRPRKDGSQYLHLRRFNVTAKSNGHKLMAYLAIIRDPLAHVSVIPSISSHTEHLDKGASRYRCEEADPLLSTARHHCQYAINGGFFHMKTGQCIGNLVSHGEVLQVDGSTKRASFGIRKDGVIVTGYIHPQDVFDMGHEFEQLITGRGWLVRNGQLQWNTSISDENIDAHFVKEAAPRTGIGCTKHGDVLLLQVDGEEDIKSGLSLDEFAAIFQSLGAVEAVNLDGGGSSVTIEKGDVISRPTCNDSPSICTRPITSLVCVR